MKSNKLNTREAKIKWLKDLRSGKTAPEDLLQPITAVLMLSEGKVFAFMTNNEKTDLEEPITVEEFEARYEHKVTSQLHFVDFSDKRKSVEDGI